MSRVKNNRINYLLLENSELKLLLKKLLQNGTFTYEDEKTEKLVVSLTEKYMADVVPETVKKEIGCVDCGADMSVSPSGRKYDSRRCGKCYLKWKAEKRRQSGER